MRFIIILLCLGSFLSVKAQEIAAGFIYKKNVPEEALYLFDWLVVDPDNFTIDTLKERFYIKKRKAKLIAYVSVGELEPYREYFKKADKNWIIGENRGWNSKIADLRKKEYIDFLFDNRFNLLKDYDGFFLDTVDSYQMVLKTEKERAEYEEGLVKLIKRLRKTYPDRVIIINRGFEIVDRVKSDVDGFVAESLFYGLDVGKDIKYKKMKPEDTNWLLQKLNYVKSLGLKVIIIDYVDPKSKKLQKEVAKMIYEKGFIPYVADKTLNTVGVSLYQLKPRKVLMIHDGKLDDAFSDIHRLVQPWVEYQGYVPVVVSIDKVMENGEFKNFISDEYAAVFLSVSDYKNPVDFSNWLIEKKNEGLKIFFVGDFPNYEEVLKEFGVKKLGDLNIFDRYRVLDSSFSFFETEPRFENIQMLTVDNPKKYIKVESNGEVFYPLVITDWGGYALEGSFIVNYRDSMFAINPVDFIRDILQPDFPVPDTTTESGRRILTVHIDGDAGFGVADFNTGKNLMEIIRDEFIKKYPVPHTVSIIEGEIAPYGLYPEKSKKLEEIARSIFSLENVEPASHSFSHPFKWQKIEAIAYQEDATTENYNLNIKDYKFNLEKEIVGSVDYINRNLLPKDKKVEVFLWTGDCIPSSNALKLTYQLGIYNVNNGYTWINKREPFFSLIGPMGLNRNGYFQVYAPIQNENVYTDLWKDYYGYSKAIETFVMTDKPYRLKPISIYYHFYSGQKDASVKALREVYGYALSQQINPMFLSGYAQRVLEFRNMAIAEDIRDNTIVVRSEGNLKTLRIDKEEKTPDISKSKGVVGFTTYNNSIYLNLDNSGDYRLNFGDKSMHFYLINSNGQIVKNEREVNSLKIGLKSYQPLEYEIFSDDSCKIQFYPKPDTVEKNGKIISVKYKKEKEGYVEAGCP